jgi:hypothetical protein
MPRKAEPKPDDPEQSKRFIDMVREVGAEEPSPNFERVFRKVVEQPKGFPSKQISPKIASSKARHSERRVAR